MRVGLISDTHGLLRPEALAFLQGSDHIIHAGDIGDAEILETLRAIAAITVVRGNVDQAEWSRALPETAFIQLGESGVYVIHDVAELDLDLKEAAVHAVIAGHSHKPSAQLRAGILFVNPGSAGRRRFKLPISAGELVLGGGVLSARIIDLQSGELIASVICP